MTTIKSNPPIHCTPCRVTKDGQRYRIDQDGSVTPISWTDNTPLGLPMHPHTIVAKEIRQHASRLRRNRNARERSANARERNQARRDLGMKQTPYGWE